MKVLLILPASPSSSPYIKYYTSVLDNNKIEYDICCWDRKNEVNSSYNNYFVFKNVENKSYFKLFNFLNFRRFILRILKKNKYDCVIVFTIQLSVFLSNFLLRNFKKKYILDIRDYSPVLKVSFFKSIFEKLLKHSAFNCISSPGFKSWLPVGEYVISHNIAGFNFSNQTKNKLFFKNPVINILTIGILRDMDANSKLIKNLVNKSKYRMQFSGDGPATKLIEEFVKTNKISNVITTGRYNKSDEIDIVNSADLINILLPWNLNSRTCMANRFYLSVMCRVPMIVDANTTQSEFVEKYFLGVVVSPKENIEKKISEYIENFNPEIYKQGCESFINLVKSDIHIFENKIINILN